MLRKEAAFGCCVCGHPILQYHHIVPYALEEHFRVEDMMALCPNGHEKANNGGFTEVEQRAYKAEPFNRARGYAHGQLAVKQREHAINLGGHVFVADAGDVVRIGGEAILHTATGDDGAILLSARLYDENDSLVAEIVENEWISHDPLPWDIEFRHRELSVRSAHRKVSLQIDCKQDPLSVRGELRHRGRMLRIAPSGLHVDGASMVGSGTVKGAVIVLDAGGGGFRLQGQHAAEPIRTVRRPSPKVGRNNPCPCGSGKKYKRCCGG